MSKEQKQEKQEHHDLAVAGTAQVPALELTKDSDIMSLMLDTQKYDMCLRIARHISANNLMPKHLNGDENVCFQVVMQAFQWGMNPFIVAPCTYAVGQRLSFEAQLVNTVINKLAPIKERLHYEWFGDWDKYIESGCKRELEKGLGIKVWTTLKDENEPREVEVKMNSIGIRNSTNWKNDPQQQISYVAVQRWARLYCPDVIKGVYTPDELPDDPGMKNITPQNEKPAGSQSEALLGKLKKNDKGNDKPKTEKAEAVEAELVDDKKEDPVSVVTLIEAEIRRSNAPIVIQDVDDWFKTNKAMGPDVQSICKRAPKWDTWVRENVPALVKLVGEWKAAQAENAE